MVDDTIAGLHRVDHYAADHKWPGYKGVIGQSIGKAAGSVDAFECLSPSLIL
jgi:hypothetical protein